MSCAFWRKLGVPRIRQSLVIAWIVLVAFNFTELHTGWACHRYLAFGELSRFVYYLLQKRKRSSDLPVIEKWEAFMLINHSCFGSIEEEHFLKRTCPLSSLEKINISFFRKYFRKYCRRFLEDFVSTILSTVAACSPVGRSLSCFGPKIISGGDDYSAFHLVEQLLDGLFEFEWIRGSEVEPANADFYSFVREQRQVEVSSSRSRVPLNSLFAFCNEPGFCSPWNFNEINIMSFLVLWVL